MAEKSVSIPAATEETTYEYLDRKARERAIEANTADKPLYCKSAFCRVVTFAPGRVGNTCPGCDKAGSRTGGTS